MKIVTAMVPKVRARGRLILLTPRLGCKGAVPDQVGSRVRVGSLVRRGVPGISTPATADLPNESGQSAGFTIGELERQGQGEPDPMSHSPGPSTGTGTSTEEVQAQPDGPFASSSDGEGSKTAGEDVKESASSPTTPNGNDWVTKLGPTPSQPKADPPSDDYWPIPSRASHNS